MKIALHKIKVRDLVADYEDNNEKGVRAYGGKLDVRPPYQREFIYKDAQRDAVIESVLKGFPLNVMYWSVREDGTYEIIDGQQRTISICQYVTGVYSVKRNLFAQDNYFHNLTKDIQDKILDYELLIYFCEGTESEKLEWFKIINVAGEELTEQELRNAVYVSPWLTDAKRYFSRRNCVAYQIGERYFNKSVERQEYLELAIKWISDGNINNYMAKKAKEATDATELWNYYRGVIDWIDQTFITYRKVLMRKVDWGALYKKYGKYTYDPDELEKQIAALIQDSDITNQAGIYQYIFDNNQSHLNIRTFDDNTRRRVYEKQGGKCAKCGRAFDIEIMHADHIKPWSKGGHTEESNCQILCAECNATKGGKW